MLCRCVIVSHDQAFLNVVATDIVLLDACELHALLRGVAHWSIRLFMGQTPGGGLHYFKVLNIGLLNIKLSYTMG